MARAGVNATRTAWPVIGLAVLAGVVTAVQLGKVPPALPALRAELELGLVTAGWVASMFSLCGALLGLVAGFAIERIGAWRSLALAMLILSAGSLIGACARDGATMLVARFVEGIGFVAAAVAAPGIIIAASELRHRSLALGLWGTYLPVGAAIGIVGAPPLLAAFGFRILWLVNAALCALCAVLVLRAGSGGPPAPGRRHFADGLGYLRRSPPWVYAVCFALYTAQYHAVLTWLPTYLAERHGVSLAAASASGALVVGMGAVGSLAGGWLLHRRLARWSLLAGCFAALALLATLVFSATLPVAAKVGAGALFSTVGGVLATVCLTGAPSAAQGVFEVGVGNGMAVQGANTGSLIGPPALAALVATAGWGHSWWFMAVCATFGIGIALAVARPRRRR